MGMEMIKFPKFDEYARDGDSVTVDVDGFTLIATICRDDCARSPDEEQDGFWPSLDPRDAGYIGHKSKRTLARHMAKAQNAMRAWRNDEWFYCGIAVTAWRAGIRLTGEYDAASWGVECNYPDSDNSYLSDIADDLAQEALDLARAKLAELGAA
jgi:hypothetical protein